MKFKDLVFEPHSDGNPGHLHAKHKLQDGTYISVTRWASKYHGSDVDRPYEVMLGDELFEYQTASDIDQILSE